MMPSAPASTAAPRPAWRRAWQRLARALGLAGAAALAVPAVAAEAPAGVTHARAALEARVALVRSALQSQAQARAQGPEQTRADMDDAGSPTAQWVNWPNWGNWNNWNNWPNWGNWGNWFNR